MFVAVTIVVPNDGSVRAIGIHSIRSSTDVDVAVIAFLASDVLHLVGTAEAEGLARFVCKLCAAVTVIPIPLAIGASSDAVQGMIVLFAVESCEKLFACVAFTWIKNEVSIDIGVDDHAWSHRDDNLVIEYCNSKWCGEKFFLDEDVVFVCLAVSVRVLEDDNTVAFRTATPMTSVVHTLGNPDSTVFIDVHVSRIIEHRSLCP